MYVTSLSLGLKNQFKLGTNYSNVVKVVFFPLGISVVFFRFFLFFDGCLMKLNAVLAQNWVGTCARHYSWSNQPPGF